MKRSTDTIYSLRAGGERLHASEVFLVYNRQYDTRESPQVNQKIEPGCVVPLMSRRGYPRERISFGSGVRSAAWAPGI